MTNLIATHFLECSLKQLKVLNIFVLQVGPEFDFLQIDRARKEHVHEVAIRATLEE
jgi:hypothetical protein